MKDEIAELLANHLQKELDCDYEGMSQILFGSSKDYLFDSVKFRDGEIKIVFKRDDNNILYELSLRPTKWEKVKQ